MKAQVFTLAILLGACEALTLSTRSTSTMGCSVKGAASRSDCEAWVGCVWDSGASTCAAPDASGYTKYEKNCYHSGHGAGDWGQSYGADTGVTACKGYCDALDYGAGDNHCSGFVVRMTDRTDEKGKCYLKSGLASQNGGLDLAQCSDHGESGAFLREEITYVRAVPDDLCTVPTTPGYDFTSAVGTTQIADFAPAGVTCASGYSGTVAYAACTTANDPYAVSGCQGNSGRRRRKHKHAGGKHAVCKLNDGAGSQAYWSCLWTQWIKSFFWPFKST